MSEVGDAEVGDAEVGAGTSGAVVGVGKVVRHPVNIIVNNTKIISIRFTRIMIALHPRGHRSRRAQVYRLIL
jgi:hypothetical protein